jgi:hypothetical protein
MIAVVSCNARFLAKELYLVGDRPASASIRKEVGALDWPEEVVQAFVHSLRHLERHPLYQPRAAIVSRYPFERPFYPLEREVAATGPTSVQARILRTLAAAQVAFVAAVEVSGSPTSSETVRTRHECAAVEHALRVWAFARQAPTGYGWDDKILRPILRRDLRLRGVTLSG